MGQAREAALAARAPNPTLESAVCQSGLNTIRYQAAASPAVYSSNTSSDLSKESSRGSVGTDPKYRPFFTNGARTAGVGCSRRGMESALGTPNQLVAALRIMLGARSIAQSYRETRCTHDETRLRT